MKILELLDRLGAGAAVARIWELPISYSGRAYAEGDGVNRADRVAAIWHVPQYNPDSRRPATR